MSIVCVKDNVMAVDSGEFTMCGLKREALRPKMVRNKVTGDLCAAVGSRTACNMFIEWAHNNAYNESSFYCAAPFPSDLETQNPHYGFTFLVLEKATGKLYQGQTKNREEWAECRQPYTIGSISLYALGALHIDGVSAERAVLNCIQHTTSALGPVCTARIDFPLCTNKETLS